MVASQDFNASGALLALAQQAGNTQAFNTRFAQGQQLVASARRQQAQQDALRLEQERLQLEAQQRRLGQNTPTSTRSVSNPFTRSVEQANAEFKAPPPQTVRSTPGSGTVSGDDTSFSIDDEGNVRGTKENRALSPQEIRERSNFVSGRPPATPDSLQARKQSFVDQRPDLTPEAKRALQPFIDDPSIDLRTVGVEANRLEQQSAQQNLTRGQQVQFNRSLLREQVGDVESRIRDIEDILSTDVESGGFGVKVFGRDLTEVFNDLAGKPGGILGIGARAAQPEAQRLVRELQELRLHKNQLRAQEQSLIADQVSQPQFQSPQQTQSLSEQSTESLLKELLGQ